MRSGFWGGLIYPPVKIWQISGGPNADGNPMNPFQNESFKHASARLTKNKFKKRVLKGGAKSFAKRKKVTEE